MTSASSSSFVVLISLTPSSICLRVTGWLATLLAGRAHRPLSVVVRHRLARDRPRRTVEADLDSSAQPRRCRRGRPAPWHGDASDGEGIIYRGGVKSGCGDDDLRRPRVLSREVSPRPALQAGARSWRACRGCLVWMDVHQRRECIGTGGLGTPAVHRRLHLRSQPGAASQERLISFCPFLVGKIHPGIPSFGAIVCGEDGEVPVEHEGDSKNLSSSIYGTSSCPPRQVSILGTESRASTYCGPVTKPQLTGSMSGVFAIGRR